MTVCECQARLRAELDENGYVIRGYSRERVRRRERPAPAHAIRAGEEWFQIGWNCPFCGRNVLRSFYRDAVSYREVSAPAEDASGAAR
ncbi:MAG: hypothetical protein OZ921_22015 [Sorangiineae bacterium]|nr:hypothetical protein [Polyangiaceae bacterium]MEB2325205.1 hypothetical protein [Sorangiineae bacterium]